MSNFKRLPSIGAFLFLALAAIGGVYTVVAAGVNNISPSDIETVALAPDPLYAQGTGQKPTLTLALSVEFPTVGAQYRDNFDPTKQYIGYFDVNSCYSYKNDANADLRYFERKSSANSMKCGGLAFSGNFMNWASSSSIDVLRYGLTGGDRFIDNSDVTVLQRAVLQEYGNGSFWNSGAYFPQKNLSRSNALDVIPKGLLGNYSGDVYISNCLNRIFFSTSSNTGSCASPAANNSLGAKIGSTNPANKSDILSTDMFYTRVKVCESSDPRASLCQSYPSGNRKPVGNMQKYSDRVRLAAFGYLLDSGTQRYGGVLRAPMTFVGARSYDADGNLVAGTNPYMEWDANTGIFNTNPRGASEGNSGVINYLNKFGRSGSYKGNDPVGELYYESLRYLQGLQPTSQAVSNVDNIKKDGFPAYASWDDPFANDIPGNKANEKSYACLRNSILVIGDVNTHADKSLPGNTRTSYNDFNRASDVDLSSNVPNFVNWTRVVGGFESGAAISYVDGNGVSQTTSNPTNFRDGSLANLESLDTGSGGSAAYYMAGAAYWAHTHDIRGAQWSDVSKQRLGMRISTYVLDVNEGSADSNWNNRKRTQFYLTAKYGGFDDFSGVGNPFLPPNNQNQYDNRQWAKNPGSDNPDPKNYFLSSDAQAVLDALDNIFIAATKVTNSIASPAISSKALSADNNYFYLASFDPEFWSGDVKRNIIKTDGSSVIQGGVTAEVSAAKRMDVVDPATRKIYVGKKDNTGLGIATEFKWGQIESALKNTLGNVTNALPQGDGYGEQRLNFIRGDRSLEATKFRKRGSRMGDVINSGVAYSGLPSDRYSGADYFSFAENNSNRTKAIFVGANDGMLHAFNADTMDELFAYIPSWMVDKLKVLTNIDYNSSQHTSYVDATPTTGEAQVGDKWKTVLVSGTGGGGQGVFALDITDPAAFDASKVMWEFSDRDDADLGNVVGTIQLMKLRTNALSSASETPTYKWFAVVPSGVNNYAADGNQSATGKPAIFLLDLSKDPQSAWVLGQNYFKFSFPFLSTINTGTAIIDSQGKPTGKTRATGIVNFEATADVNGAVRYFYVPDLHGQLWKLDMTKADFSSNQPDHWNLEAVSVYGAGSGPVPMFQAQTKAGKAQPISMAPTVAYGPQGSYILAFGTGKYLEAKDNSISGTTLVQSFYTLYDVNDQTSFETGSTGRRKLQRGTVDGNNISTLPFIWSKPSDAVLSNPQQETPQSDVKKSGWYIDYPNGGSVKGEQQVSNAVLFGDKIIFNSIMPPAASNSACSGGSSYTYMAGLATGLGSVSTLVNGAQGSPLILRVNNQVSSSDSTGQRTQSETIAMMAPSSVGDGQLVQNGSLNNKSLVGRLSWRQINNYRDLKSKSW